MCQHEEVEHGTIIQQFPQYENHNISLRDLKQKQGSTLSLLWDLLEAEIQRSSKTKDGISLTEERSVNGRQSA